MNSSVKFIAYINEQTGSIILIAHMWWWNRIFLVILWFLLTFPSLPHSFKGLTTHCCSLVGLPIRLEWNFVCVQENQIIANDVLNWSFLLSRHLKKPDSILLLGQWHLEAEENEEKAEISPACQRTSIIKALASIHCALRYLIPMDYLFSSIQIRKLWLF